MLKTNKIELRKVFYNISGYGISHFITILQPIIITPLITRKLSLEEYGAYSLFYVFLGFFLPIISFNFSSFLLKEFHNELKGELNKYLNIFISISYLLMILVFSISYLFKDFLQDALDLNSINLIYYSICCSFFLTLINLCKSVLRSNNQIKKFVFINISFVISNTLIVSCLYWSDTLNLESVLLSFTFVYAILSLIIIRYVLKINLIPSFILDLKITKRVFIFCFPLVIYSLTAMIFTMSDRLIINEYISKESLAIYSATFQLAFGISAFGTVLQLAWGPFVLKEMTFNNTINERIKKYAFLALITIIIYSLIYYLLYPIVFKLYYPKIYFEGLNFYYWFILGGIFQSVYWLVNPILLVLEKNMYFFYITLLSSILSISLNLYVIDYGIEYLAFVYFISWLFQLITLIFVTKFWYLRRVKSS